MSPLYEYVCPAGHQHEAIRSRETEAEFCACGQAATRKSFYPVSEGHKWASDFHFTSSMQAAHEEAKGYAAEVRSLAAEERANGYT